MKKIVSKSSLLFLFIFIFITSITSGCGEENDDDNCDECISAQKHLFEALQSNRSSATVTNNAFARVKSSCKNGKEKANNLVSTCQLAETPNYSCD